MNTFHETEIRINGERIDKGDVTLTVDHGDHEIVYESCVMESLHRNQRADTSFGPPDSHPPTYAVRSSPEYELDFSFRAESVRHKEMEPEPEPEPEVETEWEFGQPVEFEMETVDDIDIEPVCSPDEMREALGLTDDEDEDDTERSTSEKLAHGDEPPETDEEPTNYFDLR